MSLDFLLLFTYLLSDHHRVTGLSSSLYVSLVWSSSCHWTFFFSLRISCLIIIVSLDFLLLFTYLLSDHHRVTGLSSFLYVSLVWSSSCHWTFFFSLFISCLIIIMSLDFVLLFIYLLSDHHRATGLSSSLYVSLVWSSSCHWTFFFSLRISLSDHHRVTGLSSFFSLRISCLIIIVSLDFLLFFTYLFVWSSSCHWTFFSLRISCLIIIVSLDFLLFFTYLLSDHHRVTGLSSSLRISRLIIIVSLDFLRLFTYLLSDHHRVTGLSSFLYVSLVWSSSCHWTFFVSLRISCLIIIVSLDFLHFFTYLFVWSSSCHWTFFVSLRISLSDHHRVTGLSSSLYVSLVWSSSCHWTFFFSLRISCLNIIVSLDFLLFFTNLLSEHHRVTGLYELSYRLKMSPKCQLVLVILVRCAAEEMIDIFDHNPRSLHCSVCCSL